MTSLILTSKTRVFCRMTKFEIFIIKIKSGFSSGGKIIKSSGRVAILASIVPREDWSKMVKNGQKW